MYNIIYYFLFSRTSVKNEARFDFFFFFILLEGGGAFGEDLFLWAGRGGAGRKFPLWKCLVINLEFPFFNKSSFF